MSLIHESTDSIDELIVSPGVFAQPSRIYSLFDRLRAEDPVHWTQPVGYRPFWTITKHADIVEVEKNNTVFLSNPRTSLRSRAEEEAVREHTGGRLYHIENMPNFDGTTHRAHRSIFQSWFLPPNLAKYQPEIEKIARDLVDGIDAGQEFDFCQRVANPFPLRVIMMILGVPREDEEFIMGLEKRVMAPADPDGGGGTGFSRIDAANELFAYFGELLADRRAAPRDDLATVIAHATVDGETIDEQHARAHCLLMATAGHDSTSYTIAGGLHAVLEDSAQLQLLRDQPATRTTMADEMVRWVTPVKSFMRTAAKDYELRGRTVRAGEAVLLAYPSGNRDSDKFDDPYLFRVDRRPNQHLGFGAGVHSCLGIHLAKLEIRTLFDVLLDRARRIELQGEPSFWAAINVQGLKRLPVKVDF